MNIQPYQEESNRLRKAESLPVDIAKGAVGLATSGALANKILPLLSPYVPTNIMQKGLSKINPKFGSFMEQAEDMGFGVDQIRDFLKNKILPPEPPKKEQIESNPLKDFETNYPELAQGLMNTIQAGQSPQAAAGILKTSTALGKQVKKLEKEVGKNFVDYVLELFGPSMQQSQPTQMQQQPQIQQQQIQQSPDQGQGLDSQILAALDKILKM